MASKFFLFLCIVRVATGQVFVGPRAVGLRVHGTRTAGFPAASLKSDPVSVSFDVPEHPAPDLYLRIIHCDRDWNKTDNSFVNDQFRSVAKFPISYTAAPAGAEGYAYSYHVQLPGANGVEEFQFSGNYEFEVRERTTEDLFVRGRMFVVEARQPISIRIANRQLPSEGAPFNQAHAISVPVIVKEEGDDPFDRIQFNLVRIVDIYKNRDITSRSRIDVDDVNPDTFVDGFGTPRMTFLVDNVLPGNEYRSLDITNVDFYPQDKQSRARNGADVSRMFHQGEPDRDGRSVLTRGTRFAGYVNYRFELLREEAESEPVYVKGDFSGWRMDERYKMTYDAATQRYTLDAALRRGAYDYEYAFASGSAVALEGNDWRTTNVYTALLYYKDTRQPGLDRIIGFAQLKSSEHGDATSRSSQ